MTEPKHFVKVHLREILTALDYISEQQTEDSALLHSIKSELLSHKQDLLALRSYLAEILLRVERYNDRLERIATSIEKTLP